MFTSGRKLTSEAEEFFHQSRNLLSSIAYNIEEELQTPQGSENKLRNISLKDYAAKIWNEEYNCLHNLETSQSDVMWNNVMSMMSVVDGAHPEIASCLSYHYYKEIDIDIILRDSYSVLIDLFQKDIPQGSIKLESKVKSIYWNRDKTSGQRMSATKCQKSLNDASSHVEVTSSDMTTSENQDKVRVSYTDETGCIREIDADHVIVTVSLGVLKKYHKDLFVPNLPIQQQKCIHRMGFGVVGKLFIHFGKKIWNDLDFGMYILYDSDFGDSDPRSWCEGLDFVQVFNGHTLILWLNDLALKRIKAITKDEIWQHLYEIIKRHCGDTKPMPDDIFVTQWGENENFLGSYSFTALGETNETLKTACEPIHVGGIPRILFAGEAFHESRFGTVDGAYLTGLREANRIVESYRYKK